MTGSRLKSRSRRAKRLFNELSKIALSWRFQVVSGPISSRERQAVIARHQGVRLTYGELKAAVGRGTGFSGAGEGRPHRDLVAQQRMGADPVSPPPRPGSSWSTSTRLQ